VSEATAQPAEARPPRRARTGASIVLAILAAAAVLAGGTCVYLRTQILDSSSFADRTVAALKHEPVRRVVAREITVQAIDQGSSDLIAARPLITSIVETLVSTTQFRGLIHTVADQAHRLLFDRGGGNVAFSLADAGTVVISALNTLAPDVAKKVPRNLDATLLDLRSQSFAVKTLRAGETIRTLAIVLPLLALLLLALAIAVAPRRRLAVTRCAVALAVAGLAMFADLLLLRHATLTNLYGSEELSNVDVRAAAGALWDSYVGELSEWALALAAIATVIAAASASVLRPYTAGAKIARLRTRLFVPRSQRGIVLRGLAALAAGLLLIAEPTFVLDLLVVVCGVLLVYFGAGELLSAAGVAPDDERTSLRRSRSGLAAAAIALGLLIGGVAVALGSSSVDGPLAHGPLTCNGYAQLCARRLDQVVFAGTHNAMSAADTPGWLIANQSRSIARQLDDGIRAFKISTHYGIGKAPGHVRTDIAAEGERVNRVSEKLDPQGRSALERFSASIGFGSSKGSVKGKPEVWLCHSLCELGATKMVTFLETMRKFLQKNPGNVLILFDEDYVSEGSLERVFKASGLYSHLAVLRHGQQMPTLGELIRSQHNVLVFTQEPVSGKHPWNMNGFDFIQDTPLGAVKPKQFSCALYRGLKSNPLLTMNDWADVFPPRRSPNVALNKRSFIVKRARQCETERHHLPNLILTDYYDSGDVVGAARVLNGLGEEPPARIMPLERRG
jgi:hypothetical protein